MAPIVSLPGAPTLDGQILPRFGDPRLSKLRREDIERWQAERLVGTTRKEEPGDAP